MTNLFASYRIIDAKEIVRRNINPKYVREDLNDLIAALDTVTGLRPRNAREREIPILDRKTVRTIKAKFGLVELLEYYGYELNDDENYVFKSATTTTAREQCRNGMREVEDLLQDLEDACKGSLNGFDEFIGVRRPRTPPPTPRTPPARPRTPPARPRSPPTRPRSPPARPRDEPHYQPLPSPREIDDGNAATLAVVKSLKQSLVSEYSANPAPRFIRRRIARLLYRHIYPESRKVTDDDVDKSIDRAIQSIKQDYQSRNPSDSDPVCIECLIRTQFDETEARKMLRQDPPNLDVPVEPARPTTGTSLTNIIEPVKQQHRLLNEQNNNNNGLRRQNSGTGDRWEAVKHVAEAVQRLRQKDANATASEEIFSQMCRVLYGELFPILGSQSLVKIELFARQICDSSVDRVENLDISTIRTVLSSDNGTRITDNFIENAGSLLSIQCPICFNGFPKNQMEAMYLCDHKCCLPCLKAHYRTAINDIQGRATLNRLTCFDTPHPIAHDVQHMFFIYLGAKIKQWFKDEDPDLIRKYDEKIFEATRGAEIKRCGNPRCVSSVYVDDNDRVTRVYCQSCNFAQCGLCCQKWHAEHSDMSCDEYTEWLRENDPDDADVQAIRYLGNNAIVCPQCQEVFLLDAGACEHYICPSCDSDFCRMCSEFLYPPKKARKCPYDDCTLKAGFHGHCKLNCFRELRDFPTDHIINLLEENGIDKDDQLENITRPADQKCISPGCSKPTINDSGHRYCGNCYKYWLCLLIWNNQLEPWTIYEDHNLRQILTKARIPCSAQATKNDLVALCQQHLNGTLGRPKALKPRRN